MNGRTFHQDFVLKDVEIINLVARSIRPMRVFIYKNSYFCCDVGLCFKDETI